MTLFKYILAFFLGLFLTTTVFAQDLGETWSSNITLKCKTNFGRGGGADVWGWKAPNGTPYALVALDGGLSIVNTQNPSSPTEKAHINHSNTAKKLYVADVETFDSGGNTYAYLSVHKNDKNYFVIIINLNQAINQSGFYGIDPENGSLGSVFVGRIQNLFPFDTYPREIAWQAHTLTIDGGYLYVATLKDKIPVWNLNSSPTSPTYKGYITVPAVPQTGMAAPGVHEMYVKSTGATTSKIYAACSRGGLQVINLNLSNMSFTKTSHIYDSDKSSPAVVNSTDTDFNYRQSHSAWPTDDGQYIFTTDELSFWPPDSTQVNMPLDPNLYIDTNVVLRSVHRQGNFLRTWKTSQLGTSGALKGGFYVKEGNQTGYVNLNSINSSSVPNSIHQMYGTGNVLYVTHYTQGLRALDISNPENLVEVGYYDDYPEINDTPYDPYFFRDHQWYNGIYGVYPDPDRPGIVYAGSITSGFYIFDVLSQPAVPTGFNLSGSVGENPTLTWDASTDVGLDGYKIYQNFIDGGYYLLTTLDKSSTSFTDPGVIIGSGKFAPRTCYYITAFNITGKESDPSFPKCTGYSALSKSHENSASNNKPDEFLLSQCYPNPFNPSTKISYQLPGEVFVNLIVYNSLGQVVEILVNQKQSAGIYSVEFTSENLPSGLYIYKLIAGSYSSAKKMILLR